MNVQTIVIIVVYNIIFLLFYPFLLNLSSILVEEGIGTTATAGIISALYTVGGAIAGLIFGSVFKVCKRFTIPLSWLLVVISFFLGAFSHSVIGLTLASFLSGIGFFVAWPACNMKFSEMLTPEGVGLAAGIFVTVMGVCMFLCAPWIGLLAQITGDASLRLPIIVGAVGGTVLCVIWSIIEMVRKPKNS